MTALTSVSSVGAVIRAYRKASGLSQKDLARLGGVSRATLNYLESGRDDLDVGAAKLLAVMSALGVPLGIPSTVDRPRDEDLLSYALRGLGKGKKRLAEGSLIEALASGRVPPGTEQSLGAFLESAAPGVGLAAIRLAAARSGNPPKEIAKNARALVKTLHISSPEWLRAT